MKKITLSIVMCFVFSCTLFSQKAGDLNTQIQTINFNQQLSNVSLDPNPKIGLETRQSKKEHFGNLAQPSNLGAEIGAEIVRQMLSEIGINAPGWVFDVVNGLGDFSFVTIKPTLNAGLTVDYGGYIELNDVGNADLKVDYPVEITITYPEANTFGCGDEFTIQTSYVVNEKENMLQVTPPFYEMEVGPILENLKFQVGAGLYVKACFGLPIPGVGCAGVPQTWDLGSFYIINESIPLPSFLNPLPPLVNACENAFGTNKQESDIIACTTGASPILGIAQNILEAYNQSSFPPRNYGFASITNNQITIETPDLPTGAPPLPEINGVFKKVTNDNLSFSSLNDGKKLKVSGVKNDISKLDFDLISLLEFGGIPTSISLGGEIGSLDFGDLSPTFSVNQNMNFEFDPKIHISVELGIAMDYKVVDDVLGIVDNGYGTTVNLIAGQKIVAIYPEALSIPTQVESSSTMDGDFTTLTTQEYFDSTKINLMQLKIGSSFNKSIYETEIGKTSTGAPIKIQDHTFNLNGFDAIPLNDLILDPENPIINIENLTIEDIVNIGGGEREVVYKVIVNNGGDVELRNSNVVFDLSEAFSNASNLEVKCIFSEDLMINPDFDGISETSLLDIGNTLAVGQTSMIEILVRVKPEIAQIDTAGCFEPVEYYISAFAKGTSPIGTEVINNFYQCTGERTGEDILAVVDLGASIIESINDYAIYGWKGVFFDKALTQSWGNVGSSETIRFENVSLQGGSDATIVGDLHAGNEVYVQGESRVVVDYIQVANSVKIPNRKSSMNETGATSDYSSCVAVMDKIELNVDNHFGSKKIKIDDNETVQLAPGKYKEVRLQANSILKMSAGTYNIGRWVFLGDNAQVLYNTENGAIDINIGVWQALGRDNLSLSVENNRSAEDVHYNYKGNQPCIFNNSFVQGQIIAPNAEIEFALESVLEGSCYADKVNFKTGSSFIGNTYLDEINLNPGCLEDKLAKGDFNRGFASKDIPSTKLQINAYPNPMSKNITITANEAMKVITVRNYVGQELFLLKLNENRNEKTIDLERFPSGIYFITVQFVKDSHTFKIIKN